MCSNGSSCIQRICKRRFQGTGTLHMGKHVSAGSTGWLRRRNWNKSGIFQLWYRWKHAGEAFHGKRRRLWRRCCRWLYYRNSNPGRTCRKTWYFQIIRMGQHQSIVSGPVPWSEWWIYRSVRCRNSADRLWSGYGRHWHQRLWRSLGWISWGQHCTDSKLSCYQWYYKPGAWSGFQRSEPGWYCKNRKKTSRACSECSSDPGWQYTGFSP